jgi:hypothetical protein
MKDIGQILEAMAPRLRKVAYAVYDLDETEARKAWDLFVRLLPGRDLDWDPDVASADILVEWGGFLAAKYGAGVV